MVVKYRVRCDARPLRGLGPHCTHTHIYIYTLRMALSGYSCSSYFDITADAAEGNVSKADTDDETATTSFKKTLKIKKRNGLTFIVHSTK